jgi:dihydroxyacetone kinase-like protein
MQRFTNAQGQEIQQELIRTIRENKLHLSELDGAIGDGDHGINMNKGFSLWAEELASNPVELYASLMSLSKILLARIGGAMGPLYGMFFRGLAKGCEQEEFLDAAVFGRMLSGAVACVQTISQAKVGDKTLMDALLPAEQAYRGALEQNKSFLECLEAMATAAEKGRDSTRELIAKVGRASRLGERARGSQDAGAASCALILTAIAGAIRGLLAGSP